MRLHSAGYQKISIFVSFELADFFLNRLFNKIQGKCLLSVYTLSKGCHLDVVREPSTPYDPESDAGGSLSFWQGHPSR
jgi:hypothetical protein